MRTERPAPGRLSVLEQEGAFVTDIRVATQAELEDALKRGARPILIGLSHFVVAGSAHVVARESAHVVAWGSAHVEARGSAHVEALDSAHVEARGYAHVEAWDSAHVEALDSAHVVARGSAHVEARGSAHVVAWGSAHVEAWDSAHVVALESAHVEARGSAHVEAWDSAHVVARESAHVVAWGSAHVEASPLVAIHQHSGSAQITGGVVIRVERPDTAAQWCEFYGVSVVDGIATVFKALSDDYRSPHGLLYLPGSAPEAPDWDGGKAECGGGLHFAPSPLAALEFHAEARRFVRCDVALDDIVVHPNAAWPQKIKARRVINVVEVNRYGDPVATEIRA